MKKNFLLGLQEKVEESKIKESINVRAVKIILKSKKGQKLGGAEICSECELKKKPIYRYLQSNIGPVYLCNECKIKLFNRSFGSIGPKGENLIGKTVKSGGAWETNRRKH